MSIDKSTFPESALSNQHSTIESVNEIFRFLNRRNVGVGINNSLADARLVLFLKKQLDDVPRGDRLGLHG